MRTLLSLIFLLASLQASYAADMFVLPRLIQSFTTEDGSSITTETNIVDAIMNLTENSFVYLLKGKHYLATNPDFFTDANTSNPYIAGFRNTCTSGDCNITEYACKDV